MHDGSRSGDASRVRRVMLLGVTAALLISLLPIGAAAQEIGEPPPEHVGDADIRLLDQRLDVVQGTNQQGDPVAELRGARPFVWTEGRRFYQWKPQPTASSVTQALRRRAGQLVAHDLDSLEQVAQSDPDLNIMAPDVHGLPINGHLGVVDPDHGVVYVPWTEQAGSAPTSVEDVGVETGTCASYNTAGLADSSALAAAQRCFTGLYALDGDTLEIAGTMRFDAIGLDLEVGGVPVAVAMAFSRPAGAYSAPKVHVLLEEQAVLEDGAVHLTSRSKARWVAQFNADPGSTSYGRVDWVRRVEACQGNATSESGSTQWNGPSAALFRNLDPVRPTIWVACPGAGVLVTFVTALDLDPADPDGPPVAQRRWAGPGQSAGIEVDPASERLVIAQSGSIAGQPATWWVFDGGLGAFIGRIDLGYTGRIGATSGLDPTTGRLYFFTARHDDPVAERRRDGGLGYVDLRQPGLSQPLWLPRFAPLSPARHHADANQAPWQTVPIVVDPAVGDRPTRLLVRPGRPIVNTPYGRCDALRDGDGPCHFFILEDRVPAAGSEGSEPAPETAEAFDDVRSDDVPERPGATTATLDGDVRGYGFRAVQVGGVGGAVNQAGDPRNYIDQTVMHGLLRYSNPCWNIQRELVLGMTGSPERGERARIDGRGNAVATARPLHADPNTQGDLKAPTRCGGDRIALMGGNIEVTDIPTWAELGDRVPVRGFDAENEPGIHSVYEHFDGTDDPFWHVSCVTSDDPDDTRQNQEDPVLRGMSAEVACDQGALTSTSRGSALAFGPVRVANAQSVARVEHRPDGGVLAQVESATHGIVVVGEQGMVTIDSVRAKATAWATGRSQPDAAVDPATAEAAVADDACDTSSGAGACYSRSIGGVTVLDAAGDVLFACDLCASEDSQRALVQGMQAALGASWIVALRNPDPRLAAGAPDGTQAGISKMLLELEADQMLKGDLLPTLPALELMRVTDSQSAPGRQVYQFAGIETALTYGIQCLLTVVEGECTSEPASLSIELTDPNGVPLPGGAFEVHEAGEDGVLGLEDLDSALAEPLVCVTGPDGTCGFDVMPAGTYVVHQALAPDGYVPMDDQLIELPAGGVGTLTVVNGNLPVTGIAITLTDLDGEPLKGGEFEVHAGESVADGATAVVTCSTDAVGVCRFPAPALDTVDSPLPLDLVTAVLPDAPQGLLQVPAGGYTVRQASAPDGYEPVEDIPFDLPEDQIARVELSNGPVFVAGDEVGDGFADTGGFDVGPAPVETTFASSPAVAEPVFTVEYPDGAGDVPLAAGPEDSGSLGQQVLMLPGNAARFALRHPKEAVAFGGVLLLFAAAAAGAYRRRLVLDLLSS